MTHTSQGISPLRQRMIDDMRMRKLAPKTRAGYVRVVRQFTAFLGRPPDTATVCTSRRFRARAHSVKKQDRLFIMEIRISPDAVVSGDRSFVVFDAHIRERSVECSIAREALEQYFWAPVGASDAQLLKSYADGRKRIEAIVCRKLLATPGEAIGLSMSDFAR